MAQYLLAVHTDYNPETAPDEETMQTAYRRVDVFNKGLMDTGVFVFAGGLHPPSSATVVDASKGDVITTDGPYAETREVLGGFWVIDVPDLDVALDLAAKGSAACGGPVEVRPFQSDDAPA